MKRKLEAVVTLINEYRAIRNARVRSASLREPMTKLRKGASARDLAHLETALGRPLPPSFKEFLSVSDGWDDIAPGFDLLSCKELVRTHTNTSFARWHKHIREYRPDLDPQRCFVIGTHPEIKSKYVLLIPASAPKPREEWRLVLRAADKDHHKSKSFDEFLGRQQRTYAKLIQDLR